MRSLEHCLNDIMKGVNDGGHHDYKGKPYYPRIEDHIVEETGGYDGLTLPIGSPARSSPQSQNSDMNERFSRKVFVGGLPPDIDEGMFCFSKCMKRKKIKRMCFYIFQMKSLHPSDGLVRWLLIGHIKQNQNHIFLQKDMHFYYFKYVNRLELQCW